MNLVWLTFLCENRQAAGPDRGPQSLSQAPKFSPNC